MNHDKKLKLKQKNYKKFTKLSENWHKIDKKNILYSIKLNQEYFELDVDGHQGYQQQHNTNSLPGIFWVGCRGTPGLSALTQH